MPKLEAMDKTRNIKEEEHKANSKRDVRSVDPKVKHAMLTPWATDL